MSANELTVEIDQAKSSARKSEGLSFGYASRTANEVARVWHDILLLNHDSYTSRIEGLWDWLEALSSPLYTTTLTSLARSSAHAGESSTALRFAYRAAEITAAAREAADTRAETYVGLARAVLPASSDEALGYFNEAARVAAKLGDESLSRWDALLDLADRTGRQNDPAPEVAYHLARCAELTHEYVRDKHFDWNGTVRAIASICPPSSLAILSRWRDRGFGHIERLLPWVTEYLVECGYLSASSVLPLIAFRYRWTPVSLLETTLWNEKDQDVG
jgi:hypothetical protein